MKELVELLKQARQEKNITLEEISQRTKINLRYLKALEEGDTSPFAGEVYVKGVLTNYAGEVGLDPKEVLNLYKRLRHKDASPEAVLDRPVQAPARKQKARSFRIPFSAGLVVLALVLLAGLAWTLFGGSDRNKTGENKEKQPPEESLIQEPEEKDAPPVPPAPPAQEKVSVVLESTDGDESKYVVTGAEEVAVRMQFTGRCWVRLLIDGRVEEEKSYQPGEELTATGQTVWVRLGNPRGALVAVNELELAEVRRHERPHSFSFSIK